MPALVVRPPNTRVPLELGLTTCEAVVLLSTPLRVSVPEATPMASALLPVMRVPAFLYSVLFQVLFPLMLSIMPSPTMVPAASLR